MNTITKRKRFLLVTYVTIRNLLSIYFYYCQHYIELEASKWVQPLLINSRIGGDQYEYIQSVIVNDFLWHTCGDHYHGSKVIDL